jgi:hypothetical protein
LYLEIRGQQPRETVRISEEDFSLRTEPAENRWRDAQHTSNWKIEPKLWELFLLVALSCVVFDATLSAFGGWRSGVVNFGDNAAYLQATAAIRNWDFHGIDTQHFLGYPYAIAAFSMLFHLPLDLTLSLVATVASFVSTFFVARLFDTRVAAYFALTNLFWLQLSFLGGSETLAVALALAGFWTFRRGRPLWAALLASLATTVRPLMFLALVGIGLALLYRKRYIKFLGALCVGLAIGLLYVWPLAHYFGDPFLTVHSYTSRDYGAVNVRGPHGHLFGWPFHAIIVGTLVYSAPWTNLVLTFSWIALVLAGVCAMFFRHYRRYASANPQEAIFASLFLIAIFCYDYLIWARGNFMRFSIPVMPFVFFALLRWLPKDRRILWLIGTLGAFLAACSAMGIRNIVHLR